MLIIALLSGCGDSRLAKSHCEKIPAGAGPEDFVISKKSGYIYISSHERRLWKKQGDIYRYNPLNGEMIVMQRTGEPVDLFMAPHGMDISEERDTLYVISHGRERNDNNHRILAYRINGSKLVFIGQITDTSLLVSPNDLSVDTEGNLYITNDAGKRGSYMEILSGEKASAVVFCENPEKTAGRGEVKCRKVAEGLGMANGILAGPNHVYIAATTENRIYRFKKSSDGILSEKAAVLTGAGFDNLFWYGASNQKILFAEHSSKTGFMLHMLFGFKSPSVAGFYDIVSSERTDLFRDDGSVISAVSGGFVYGDVLYLSQVYENYIVACRLADR